MRRMIRSTLAIWPSCQWSDASLRIESSFSRLAITPWTSCKANAATSGVAAPSNAWYRRTSSVSSSAPSSWNRVLRASSLAWCLLPTRRRLAGEGDAGNEDVDLPHCQSEHPLRCFDDVRLDRGRHVCQLGVGFHRDEDLEVDRAIGLDVHAHAAVRGLA